MNNHAALVTTLQAGQVVVRTSGGDQTFDVKGGSVEVLNNVVTVLAELPGHPTHNANNAALGSLFRFRGGGRALLLRMVWAR